MPISREQLLQEAIKRGLIPANTTLEKAAQAAGNALEKQIITEKVPRGTLREPPQETRSFLDIAANNPATNALLGFGDAPRKVIIELANLAPGINIPFQPSAEGTAYKVGNIAGDIGTFIGGGELLGGARALGEGIPLAGKLLQQLGGEGARGVARRAIGNAGYGALTNPEERGEGALKGAAFSLGAEAIPAIGKGLIGAFRPGKYSKQILQEASGGQSLAENTKTIENSLKNVFDQKIATKNSLYDPVFNQFGKSSIYGALRPSSEYLKIPKDILKKDIDIADFNKKFRENPTLENAHNLQSQLGFEERALKNKLSTLSVADKQVYKGFKRARKALQSDIDTFLRSENPKSANLYQEASSYMANEIAPYLGNKEISSILNKKKTSASDFSRIFNKPSEDILKIISDLPDETRQQILYSHLGKIRGNLTPQKVINQMEKLDQKGLGSALSPTFQKQLETLKSRASNLEHFKKGTGILAGASLAKGLGATSLAEELPAAFLGMIGAPKLFNYLEKTIPPLKPLKSVSKKSIKGIPLREILLSQTIPSGGQ